MARMARGEGGGLVQMKKKVFHIEKRKTSFAG